MCIKWLWSLQAFTDYTCRYLKYDVCIETFTKAVYFADKSKEQADLVKSATVSLFPKQMYCCKGRSVIRSGKFKADTSNQADILELILTVLRSLLHLDSGCLKSTYIVLVPHFQLVLL